MQIRHVCIGIVAAFCLAGCGEGSGVASEATTFSPQEGAVNTASRAESENTPSIRAQAGGAWAPPSEILKVSTNSSGAQGNQSSVQPELNQDGSKLTFASAATNLDGATNNLRQAFHKDLVTGQVTMLSQIAGTPSDAAVQWPKINPSGTKVTFYSQATNLAPEGNNGFNSAYLADLNSGVTIAATSDSNPSTPLNGHTLFARFAGDDQIVFYSKAKNLSFQDTNGRYDVFRKQAVMFGMPELVSESFGTQPNKNSIRPSASSDGQTVAFLTQASNLGQPGVANRIWMKQSLYSPLECISVGVTDPYAPFVSADGSKIAYTSTSNGDVWVHDVASGTKTLELQGGFRFPVLSGDGRYLVSACDDNPNFPEDTDGKRDIYIKDLQTGQVALVSVNFSPQCSYPSISGDGSTIAWQAGQIYLTANPLDTKPCVVSLDSTGAQANGICQSPHLSEDGRFVAFSTNATNLANHQPVVYGMDVLRLDTQNDAYTYISRLNGTGTPPPDTSQDLKPRISDDGNKVFFFSDWDFSDPLGSWPGEFAGVFYRDVAAGLTQGASGDNSYFSSTTGNFVCYEQQTVNPPYPPLDSQIYRKDIVTDQEVLVSVNSQGAPILGYNRGGWCSEDGRYVAWLNFSSSTSLQADLWLRDTVAGTSQLVAGNVDAPYAYSSYSYETIVADAVALSDDGSSLYFASNNMLNRYDIANSTTSFYFTVNPTGSEIATNDDGSYVAFRVDNSMFEASYAVLEASTGEVFKFRWEDSGLPPGATPQISISDDGSTVSWVGFDGAPYQYPQIWKAANPFD